MPKIAELREIDGAMWARVEIGGDEGSIYLWTNDEAKKSEASAVAAYRAELADRGLVVVPREKVTALARLSGYVPREAERLVTAMIAFGESNETS